MSVSSIVVTNRIDGEAGDKVELEPIMLVSGDKITTAADGISAKVTAEIVRDEGSKISIVKYRTSQRVTGGCRGHRQPLTRLKDLGL